MSNVKLNGGARTPFAKMTAIPGHFVRSGWSDPAVLTTALTGTNNDLTYTSVAMSLAANDITVRYVVAGASTALTVSVTGTAITVNVATSSGSAATSTAALIAAAIAASAPATALVTVANAAGNDGTGVVTALAATNLAGGRHDSVGRVSN